MWTATLQINQSMEQFRTGKRMRKTANNIIICKYFQFWYNNHTTQHGCVQNNVCKSILQLKMYTEEEKRHLEPLTESLYCKICYIG